MSGTVTTQTQGNESAATPALDRTIVLVGLMGAGKSSIGRRLAQRLGIAFVDADIEIERAAGRTIPEIFEAFGEPAFRDGERRVIRRLLEEPVVRVLATGGGAYMDDETRHIIQERAIALWLKADLDTLYERVSRRSNRPLLKTDDPKATLRNLMDRRYPVYAAADIIVETRRVPIETTVENVYQAVCDHLISVETPTA
ncbi:MAG: shikimate kinase [Alphaproteobacteria bacterium]|nr:shikimate kinase [Alphaproteobacteria bacterium]